MQPVLKHRWGAIARAVFLAVVAITAFGLLARTFIAPPTQEPVPETEVPSPFHYAFDVEGILHESASADESSSPYWWLDSGGEVILEGGRGKTMQGAAPEIMWRTRYALANALDTDDGRYPQNLFRLLTRSHWENVRAEMSFRIIRDNFIDSPNRNESNGLLLMSRYRDGDNLYYAGIRVDGHAVIKKKYDGTYYTMAEKPIFPGEYESVDKKNLLPHREWLHLRMETRSIGNEVRISLSYKNGDGEWQELLSARDSGEYAGTPPILGSYPLGIRTDFMDVEFDDFRAKRI
ncbi:MAG TPA: hypothetical protein VNM40_03075 [Candidatus Paceibacterota bacterium]|nr:hypothetical protein [Candidatus Paceibacterota bacterium]